MLAAAAPGLVVISTTRGRLRVHLPQLSAGTAAGLEASLRRVPGVRDATVNALTCNLLVRYDARYADALGAEKRLIVPLARDGTLRPPTTLVRDAHSDFPADAVRALRGVRRSALGSRPPVGDRVAE